MFAMFLKSNMDRFIDILLYRIGKVRVLLKSNMDRFIVSAHQRAMKQTIILKSNMDRFIVNADFICSSTNDIFKIQYG